MIDTPLPHPPGFDAHRIAYVVKRYPRYSETFIVNEILAHEREGVAVHIFALRPTLDTHFQSILSRVRAPVRYLPYPVGKARSFWGTLVDSAPHVPHLWAEMHTASEASVDDVYQAIVLARAVAELEIDHLHAHFATSATTVARLASRFSGIPYSFTAHAKDIFHESVEADDLEAKIASAASVVAISRFNRDHLVEEFPEFADRIRLIYNGLDLDEWSFTDPAERPRSIVAVGRLVEKKGFCHLIDACRLLADRGEDFSCSIIGTGELEESLRNQIRGLGLTASVELAGPRPHDEVRKAIQQAAVLAAPCVHADDGNRDGLPTVILESMALGTPVVATGVTGIPEAVEHRQTGLLVAERDANALADALMGLLDHARLRSELAAAARQKIKQQFDVHHNCAKLRRQFTGEGAVAARAAEPARCVG